MALDERTRTMLTSRELFLERHGQVERLPGVRPVILASWRRSLLAGLEPDRSRPRFQLGGPAEQLMRATREIVEPRAHHLAGTASSLALTDHSGRVIIRWVKDTPFEHRLDRHNVQPGFSFAETTVGTNSGGVVLETGRAALVAGPEHFFTESLQLTCAGAPIRHPVSRRIVGTLNLTCAYSDTSPVLLTWVTELAQQIEQRMLTSISRRERALLTAYLTEQHDSRQAVLCLDRTTVVSNATAARMLTPADQAMVWERAARVVDGMSAGHREIVDLADGRRAAIRATAVRDDGAAIGALVRLRMLPPAGLPEPEGNAGAPNRAPSGVNVLPGLVGHSPAWRRLCEQVALAGKEPLLLTGAPGTGKCAVARVLSEGASRLEVDAAWSGGAAEEWLRRLRGDLLDRAHAAVLVRHTQYLPASAWPLLASVLSEACGFGIRVFATFTSTPDRSQPPVWPGAVVDVPSLAERPDDVSLLLEELTWRVVGGLRRCRWSSDAAQVVSRVSWPRNIAALEDLVRKVARPGIDRIGTVDLPLSVRSQGARRRLIGLERVEAEAILQALRDADGNKKAAADTLNIARSTLYRKMRALGLDLAATTF
jgi:sigma-54 dependent transcriptional regulator, acetoin dehydrogenase operon transcriptional activator AcoR